MSEVSRAVINMPYELAMSSELSRRQFHGIAQSMQSDHDKRVAELEAELERLKEEADESLRANQLLWREVARLKADAERYRWAQDRGLLPSEKHIDAARTAKPDEGCPLCNGDCSAANPPVTNCPSDAAAKPEVDHE